MKESKLRRWEAALMIGVALAALWCSWLGSRQDALADRVVRLHVVANSDSQEDQAVKLLVRDAVLAETTPVLEGLDRREAMAALEAALPDIGQAAADTLGQEGFGYPVRVRLEESWFPTRNYDGFALPAGAYTALRVELGEGAGQNWWCVVFPPLCLGSVTQASTGLTAEEVALITGETPGYVIEFKAIELWEEWKAWLAGRVG